MPAEKLLNAIQLIKSGKQQVALPMLREVILADPKSEDAEDAWLWIYSIVDSVDEKEHCLLQALEINPGNQQTRRALGKLTGTSFPDDGPLEPRHDRRALFWAWVVGLLLVACAVLPVLYWLQGRGVISLPDSIALIPASPTLTATPSHTPLPPTFTPTITVTPSITFTSTATPRPSATFIAGEQATAALPTWAPFTPGHPTATAPISSITDPNFQKGVDAFDDKKFGTVVDLMSAVIKAHPAVALPYRYRGAAYAYLDRCADGLPDLETALTIDPGDAVAWVGRGILNLCLGNQQQANFDLQKALSLNGSLAAAHENMGLLYYKAATYGKSLDEYNLATAIDPDVSTAWAGKSQAQAKLKQFDACIQSAKKALAINQEEWAAYADRADCEMALQKYGEAVQNYTLYINRAPAGKDGLRYTGMAYYGRAEAYYALSNFSRAVSDYKQVESLFPKSAHLYCQLAYSYFEVKQYQNALDAAKKSNEASPECDGQKLILVEARSAFGLGKYDDAVKYIDKILFLPAPVPLAYYYRGVILQQVGRKADALASLEKFLATDYIGPEVADARIRQAQLKP